MYQLLRQVRVILSLSVLHALLLQQKQNTVAYCWLSWTKTDTAAATGCLALHCGT